MTSASTYTAASEPRYSTRAQVRPVPMGAWSRVPIMLIPTTDSPMKPARAGMAAGGRGPVAHRAAPAPRQPDEAREGRNGGEGDDVSRIDRSDGGRLALDGRPFGSGREQDVLDAVDEGHAILHRG